MSNITSRLWRFEGGLRAVCGQIVVGGLREFVSGMQAVCGRFACGLRRVSFAAGFVCRFSLSVCVLRFAFDGLRLAVCAWRFCAWRFAGGLLAVLRTVYGWQFAGGLRAVYGWQFAGGLRAASRQLSADLRLVVCGYD